MAQHTVAPGECLASIAHKYRFRKWESIYYAPENEEFRKKRPNPNVIFEGDKIVIPPTGDKTVPDRSTDVNHKFTAKSQRWMYRVHIRDEEGSGLEDEPYELRIPGCFPMKGTSGEDGLIEVQVPEHAREGKLTIAGEVFSLRFGALDPIARVKGVQARLNNLGFGAGPVDGKVGPRTRRAIHRFQLTQKDLKATGDIDDATRERLLSVHDGDKRSVPAEEDMSLREPDPVPSEEIPPGAAAPPETSHGHEEKAWRTARYGYEND